MRGTEMDRTDFEADLKARGFQEIVEGGMAPNQRRDAHSHDFEVRAMVLEGELRLGCDGVVATYRTGEVFTMAAGRDHTEETGPDGFKSIAGRKRAAA